MNLEKRDKQVILSVSAILFLLGTVLAIHYYVPYNVVQEQEKETTSLSNYLNKNRCVAFGVERSISQTIRGQIFNGFYYKNKHHKDTNILYFVKFDDRVVYSCLDGEYNIGSYYFAGKYGEYNFKKSDLDNLAQVSKNKPIKNMSESAYKY